MYRIFPGHVIFVFHFNQNTTNFNTKISFTRRKYISYADRSAPAVDQSILSIRPGPPVRSKIKDLTFELNQTAVRTGASGFFLCPPSVKKGLQALTVMCYSTNKNPPSPLFVVVGGFPANESHIRRSLVVQSP